MAAAANLARLLRTGGSVSWQDHALKAGVNPNTPVPEVPFFDAPPSPDRPKGSRTSLAQDAAERTKRFHPLVARVSEGHSAIVPTDLPDPLATSPIPLDWSVSGESDEIFPEGCDAIGDTAVPTPTAADVAALRAALPLSLPLSIVLCDPALGRWSPDAQRQGVPPEDSEDSVSMSPSDEEDDDNTTAPRRPSSTPVTDHEQAFVNSMVDLAWTATVGGRDPRGAKPDRSVERSAEAWFNAGVRRQRAAGSSSPSLLRALAAYEMAAEAGHVKAMVNAAVIHMSECAKVADSSSDQPANTLSDGVVPNAHRAVTLLERAAEEGDPRALGFLGVNLLGQRQSKLPVTPDPARAVRLLREARRLGDRGAERALRRLKPVNSTSS